MELLRDIIFHKDKDDQSFYEERYWELSYNVDDKILGLHNVFVKFWLSTNKTEIDTEYNRLYKLGNVRRTSKLGEV